MKKYFFILLGVAVAFSSSLVSCNNNDDEYNENIENDNNSVICNISISSNGNGSVSFEGYTESSIAVTNGTSVTITAAPDDGYKFMGWCTEELSTPANLGLNYTFEVSGDIDLTAVFKQEEIQDAVYQVVEQAPDFPGGAAALMEYLRDNINYPVISRENNSQGSAHVRFIVNADGSIIDAMIIKSAGDIYLDIEAIRVVSAMPNWICGKQAGKPVRVYYTLPVMFRLQ